jgi:hypothetical protein
MDKTGNLINSFNTTVCILCEGIGATFVNNLRDDADRCVVCCDTCRHVQIYPLPNETKYYEQDYTKN